MTQALLSIVYVANLVVVFTKASASAARVNEVLACQPSVTDEGAEPVELWSLAGLPGVAERADGAGLPDAAEQACASKRVPTLALRNVSFAYPGAAADAVHDATLALMPGQTLGVIGGTGSGKSTLVSLIPRLYDATEGAVEVLGRDVRAWQLKQLRQVVGMVPQQAMLVSGTIRSNLIWRDAGATDDDLWRALELAQAAEFVRALADGLDAPVEAGGKNFSGGQRQRLTIARALVGAGACVVRARRCCVWGAAPCRCGGLATRCQRARRGPHLCHAPRQRGGARHARRARSCLRHLPRDLCLPRRRG